MHNNFINLFSINYGNNFFSASILIAFLNNKSKSRIFARIHA